MVEQFKNIQKPIELYSLKGERNNKGDEGIIKNTWLIQMKAEKIDNAVLLYAFYRKFCFVHPATR